MGFPDAYLESPAVVSRDVLSRIRFRTGDLFLEPGIAGAIPAGPFDVAVCRNFLGYFRESIAVRVARTVAAQVAKGGVLFLDSFCVGKFRSLAPALGSAGLERAGTSPVFRRP